MDQEKLRQLLCDLGTAIRSKVVSAREGLSAENLAAVTGQAGGDTIFAIDRFGEDAIMEWFRASWPADAPVQIVMEGLETELCFPEGKSAADTLWKCIIDPIDGTRGLMYDKRSAWALAAIAPQCGDETRLSQILACSMTELPDSKHWRADQFSTTLDGPLVATSCDWRAGTSPETLPFAASAATN
ncbi:MAG: inositol monophosphatase, partial [Spartobacteria bacterium]